MKLRLQDRWVLETAKELKLFDLYLACRVVLISKVAIRAEGKQVAWIVICRVLIYVMQVRVIASTFCAAMVVFTENGVTSFFRNSYACHQVL